jgi:Uma2 family endonuclease
MGVLAVEVDRAGYGGRATIDLLEAIDDELLRYELVDGELVVTPPPTEWHQDAVFELVGQMLEPCKQRGLRLRDNRGVLFDDETMIIPDLVVYQPGPPIRERYLSPGQVVLAVEVVSRSSQRQDRFTKPGLLAAHKVPLYLLIDPFTSPTRLTLYQIEGQDYGPGVQVEAGASLRLPEPFGLEIDTVALA